VDDLDRVTPALLRRADEMCPRRLRHEHGARSKPSPLGDASFEVGNRLVEDAITWHKGGDPNIPGFPDPRDLEVEQRAAYRAAASAYSARFGAGAVEVHELGWTTEFPDLGVQLICSPGIPVTSGPVREIRVLRVGGRETLVDDVEIRCLLLRASEWAPAGFRIVAVDLLEDRSVEYDVDVAARLDDTMEWFRAQVALIRSRADRFVAVTGPDCRTCQCIPGCPKVTA
jgi:hypothetical protein